MWVKGRVGIGTNTPQASLQIVGGAIMPALGNNSGAGISFPRDPGGGGGDEAFIRYFVSGGETTKLLIGCQNDNDDSIGFFQSNAERMTIINGRVGIGTSGPNGTLHVAGDIWIEGGVNVRTPVGWVDLRPPGTSDMRLKDKIETISGALDKLLQLRGVGFVWREPEKFDDAAGPQMGLIAQEVEQVFPEWVVETSSGFKILVFRGFEALVVEALRELSTNIADVKARLDKLDAPKAASKKSKPKG